MWHLPGPGIEPVSSALAGRFFTTEPQGSPIILVFTLRIYSLFSLLSPFKNNIQDKSELRKYPIIAATIENLLYKFIYKYLFSTFYGSDTVQGTGDKVKKVHGPRE